MFDLSVSNLFVWILGAGVVGMFFLHIVPMIFKRVFNLFYQIKYSNYFAQKFIQEKLAEGKTFQEITTIISKKGEK